MFFPKLLLTATGQAALLPVWQVTAWGQNKGVTADQVIAKYVKAIGGADKFSSITTFFEKGDVSGNLTNFPPPDIPSLLAKQHGTFERYFKAPNLSLSVVLAENSLVLRMNGCDGTMAWSISSNGSRSESKLKPGNDYGCETGLQSLPRNLREQRVKIRLKREKKFEGQLAFAVLVQDPESATDETYYFDTQTYLLIGWESAWLRNHSPLDTTFKMERLYSDYHDVGGIKLPFKIVQQVDNSNGDSSNVVTTVREARINVPVDHARFAEPGTMGTPDLPKMETASTPVLSEVMLPNVTAPMLPEVKISNFVSCTIAQLQHAIPELQGLKSTQEQETLAALLDKVGAKTVDLVRKTPDLISHELVVESQQGVVKARQNFSYLILTRPHGQDAVALDEFRVDLKSGEKFQTDDAENVAASNATISSSDLANLAHTSQQLSVQESRRPPLSQGFASMWIYFYPLNRPESDFRYLGQQKMDGHHTLVLAFAQRPESVRLPAEYLFEGESIPIFFQGVAWVDDSDFRLVRLRTDLLSPLPEVSLRRLTAEIQFSHTPVAGVASPLWLPHDVVVVSNFGGQLLRDNHKYSNYRIFRVKTKILLNP